MRLAVRGCAVVFALAPLVVSIFTPVQVMAQTQVPAPATSNDSEGPQPPPSNAAVLATAKANALDPAVKITPRPDEPRAAKAYVAIEAHCARCHQSGRTERPMASGGVANILDLDDIAKDRALVHPGLPDASRLYDVFATRHAPLDVFGFTPDKSEPLPEEIENVRGWIADMQPTLQQCPDRAPVTADAVSAAIREAQRLERDEASDLRFLSIAHLHNACASDDDMESYRQALGKLMNSLSSAAEPVRLTRLDSAGTVLGFRLSAFGWTEQSWDAVQRLYPTELPQTVPFDIRSEARSPLPVLNGDWFAATVSQAPLYYTLLGVPARLEELAKTNGVDLESNPDAVVAPSRRAAIADSGVTRSNRMAERYAGAKGAFWMIYDFSTRSGPQDVFQVPFGPKAARAGRSVFRPDQVRVAFTLPNNFFGYALYTASGDRINAVLPGIEKHYAGDEGAEPQTFAGLSCMACHTVGVKSVHDDFRAFATAAPSILANETRDKALSLFATDSELALLLIGDSERVRQASSAIGVDVARRIRGQELVAGLADRYRRAGDMDVAAANAGMPVDTFRAKLDTATGPAAPLARRLVHGVLPRAELNRLFELLGGADAKPGDAPNLALGLSGGFLRDTPSEIGLSLWIDTPRTKVGDLVTVKAETDTDCYLTVISVDADGTGTVLFPNDFDTNNRIKAGAVVSVPHEQSPYQLRYKSNGTETILARCSLSAEPPSGIEHDFVHQKFTVLGNWENYIQDQINTEYELRRDPSKAENARRARAAARSREDRRRGRRSRRGPTRDTAGDRQTVPAKALRDGRAVIVIGRG